MSIQNKTLEAYREQREKHLKAATEFTCRVDQAVEEYNALKAKYEALIRESVQTGTDKTKELDQLSVQIEAAEKACDRRRAERAAFNVIPKDDVVRIPDVIDSFNKKVTPEFHQKRFDAVLEKLLETKQAYFEAELDYYKAVKEYEVLRDDVLDEIGDDNRYKLAQIRFSTRDQKERYLITQQDLHDLGGMEMPKSIKGVN